jgi:hypothetical protein
MPRFSRPGGVSAIGGNQGTHAWSGFGQVIFGWCRRRAGSSPGCSACRRSRLRRDRCSRGPCRKRWRTRRDRWSGPRRSRRRGRRGIRRSRRIGGCRGRRRGSRQAVGCIRVRRCPRRTPDRSSAWPRGRRRRNCRGCRCTGRNRCRGRECRSPSTAGRARSRRGRCRGRPARCRARRGPSDRGPRRRSGSRSGCRRSCIFGRAGSRTRAAGGRCMGARPGRPLSTLMMKSTLLVVSTVLVVSAVLVVLGSGVPVVGALLVGSGSSVVLVVLLDGSPVGARAVVGDGAEEAGRGGGRGGG